MIHLKVIPTDEQYEGGTDKVAYCTGSDLVWFNPRNNPKLHITVNDSTDTTLLELTATRSSDVTGDIVWTSNLSSDIVQIECSNLTFLQHFAGTIVLTATADNATSSKSIHITCGEIATSTTYVFDSVIPTEDAEWSATTADIKYAVCPIYHFPMKNDETGTSINCTYAVTFEQNTGFTDVTRTGTFTDDNNVTVDWEITQKPQNEPIVTATTYSITDVVYTSPVEATTTSANVRYKANTISHYNNGTTHTDTSIVSTTVTFDENTSTTETKNNSGEITFNDASATWEIVQNKHENTVVATIYEIDNITYTSPVDATVTSATN